MTEPVLRILAVGLVLESPAASIEHAAGWVAARERVDADAAFDVVLVEEGTWPTSTVDVAAMSAQAVQAVLLVVVDAPDAASAELWFGRGADDVVGRDEVASGVVWRRVRHAVARRRDGPWRGAGHSTDPDTGLPHRQQLVEHLSQLLALREREPSPMAVVALRIVDGDAAAAGAAGALRLLRRKLGVRLRAAVRASDVVAAVDADTFAVLLGSIQSADAATRTAAKLAVALGAPVAVAGGVCPVRVATGVACFPGDGDDAERLLRRALALAAAAPIQFEIATSVPPGTEPTGAANDER